MTVKSVRFLFMPRAQFILGAIREKIDCEKEGIEAIPVDQIVMLRQRATGQVTSVPLSMCICDYGVVPVADEAPAQKRKAV